jgi:hypothetical protein
LVTLKSVQADFFYSLFLLPYRPITPQNRYRLQTYQGTFLLITSPLKQKSDKQKKFASLKKESLLIGLNN